MIVYRMKGDRLRDEAKNIIRTLLYQHPEKTKIGFFSLKVIVYGKKSDICIEKNNLYDMIHIIYLKERGTYYALS